MIETTSTTQEADRIAAARLLLLNLGVDSDEPRWSSFVLENIVKTVMANPSGSIGDLLKAVLTILEDARHELTRTPANFLKDLVIACFTRERRSYEAIDWPSLVQTIGPGATRSQLYLAMHAVPEQFMSEELADRILRELAPTPYGEEAANLLAA